MARRSAYSGMVGVVAISLMLIIQFSTSCVAAAAAAAAAEKKPKIMPREKAAAGGTNNNNLNFIKISCQATGNPSLCYNILSPFESKVQKMNIKLLTKMALTFTIDMTNTTSKGFTKLAKSPPTWLKANQNDMAILRGCGENVNLALEDLKASYDALISVSGGGAAGTGGDKTTSFQVRMQDINIGLGGAGTMETTCIEEYLGKDFAGTPKFKKFVRKQVEAIKQLAAISLDLSAQYANTHHLHQL